MGEQKVHLVKEQKQMQRFMKALLNDVRALEYMIANDWFENDIVRIGAEQEMVLVHKDTFKPATVAMEALELMKDLPWVETELARFNLETNLTPRTFEGSCFSDLHHENADKLNQIQSILSTMDVSLILTGILPTLRKYHLVMENLTPKQRYYALMDAINAQHLGPNYELRLEGLDELIIKHDSPLIEACNTSFQVHLQVPSHDFVRQYNIAQAITAPILAISANSPLVFGKRLWHESRIALFQQALDTRSSHDHMRERSPRVTFGKQWLQESSLDIYKEDISRFRVLLGSEVDEESLDLIRKGEVPKLRHLQVHNSTVYRWNRPCYGISENGKPHLRIECRVIPSGPTVADEIANSCFWLGLMAGMADVEPDIRTKLSFDDVSDNFLKAAKFGIDTKFTWYKDKKVNAIDLISNELIGLAKHGLQLRNVDSSDIDHYLGIIQERTDKHMTGARWLLKSYTDLKAKSTEDEALSTMTSMIMENQISGKCVHDWDMPEVGQLKQYKPEHLLVSEFMTTDLFTVHEDDIVDLVAELMDWKNIRYVPVEDNKGKLSGLVSTQLVIRNFLKKAKVSRKLVTVRDLMIKDPVTIMQNSTLPEALDKMQQNHIGCLPVTKPNGELVGIVTETDFLRITSRLLSRLSSRP